MPLWLSQLHRLRQQTLDHNNWTLRSSRISKKRWPRMPWMNTSLAMEDRCGRSRRHRTTASNACHQAKSIVGARGLITQDIGRNLIAVDPQTGYAITMTSAHQLWAMEDWKGSHVLQTDPSARSVTLVSWDQQAITQLIQRALNGQAWKFDRRHIVNWTSSIMVPCPLTQIRWIRWISESQPPKMWNCISCTSHREARTQAPRLRIYRKGKSRKYRR